MTLTLVSPPSLPALDVADLAEHARVPTLLGADSEDYAILGRCRDAAVAHVERACATALIRQTWDWRLRCWPAPDAAPLPLSPILSILSVERLAADGTATAADPEDWRLDLTGARASLRAVSGALPTPPSGGGVCVRFEAGYGDAPADLPQDLLQAVRLLAAHYYDRRHAADESLAALPHGVAALLAPFQPLRL